MKQNFEHIVKETLNNHEVPYKEGAWEKFQSNLTTPTPFYKSNWFIGGVAFLAIIVSTTIYLSNNDPIEKIPSLTSKDKINNSTSDNLLEVNTNSTLINDNNSEIENNTTASNTEKSPVTKLDNNENINSNKNTTLLGETISSPNIDNSDVNETKETPVDIPEKNTTKTVSTPAPSAEFVLQKSICQGEEIILNSTEHNPEFIYKWIINEKTELAGSKVKYTPTKNGMVQIQLNILDKSNKKVASEKQWLQVNSIPRNNVEIKLDKNSIVNTYEFISTENSNSVVKWEFGEKKESTENNPSHSYKEAGKYTAKYTLVSQDGCTKTYSKKVDVKGYYNIRSDYGFSPNGDNINDNFIPVELIQINSKFVLKIYSRNGQLIYSTNSINQPWDGRLPDGSMSKFGSYIWVISITNELGKEEDYKGTITNVVN